jgi:cytochrome c biogenesis factor
MNVGGMGSAASTVTIGVQRDQANHAHAEALVAEVSIKPLIGLVWGGTVMMFVGFCVAMVRRLRVSDR